MTNGTDPTRADPSPPPEGASWRRTARRWIPPAILTGIVVSLSIHAVVLFIAGLIAFTYALRDGDGAGQGDVEMAIITDAELAALQDAALDTAAPTIPDVALPDTPAPSLDSDMEQEVTSLIDDAAGDLAAVVGAGDVSTGAVGLTGTGGGSASFFGVEAKGARFAYIVDVSGSMSVGDKLQVLQRELMGSVNALPQQVLYFIATFSSASYPLDGEVEWREATDQNKSKSSQLIEKIEASGGTEPLPAFQMVFSLRPHPEAIYFMTDGQFNEAVAGELRRMNGDLRIPIHCIALGSDAARELMKKIANESKGTYKEVRGGTK